MTKQEKVIATIRTIEAEGTALKDITVADVFARVARDGFIVHPNLVTSALRFIQLYSHQGDNKDENSK